MDAIDLVSAAEGCKWLYQRDMGGSGSAVLGILTFSRCSVEGVAVLETYVESDVTAMGKSDE